MNGSILIGSRDATNLRIEKCLGQNIVLMFGKDYFERKDQASRTQSSSYRQIIEIMTKQKMFGKIDKELEIYLNEIKL